MLYRKMGKTGDEISVLGFGCMRLPLKRIDIDEKRATRQIRYAIDKGVNYLDTAVPYHMGGSEPFLGQALADGYRRRIKLATKLPHWNVKKASDLGPILEIQLKRLKTDYIDFYLIHGLNGDSWERIKQFRVREFLEAAKREGKIRFAGFSFHDNLEAFKKIVDENDWDCCQIQYNFLDVNNQAGTAGLKYAADKGLGVIVMEPLRGGTLTKKVPAAIRTKWNEAQIKRSPAEWGLRWVWNHPEVTTALSGMNRENHIDENLRIADEAYPESLSPAELRLVEQVGQVYSRLMKVGCTGCRYCLPCPAGVDIPSCFEMYNTAHMSGRKMEARFFYLARLGGIVEGGKAANASRCKNCGKCMEKCPQHLPIPELLKTVAKDFDGLSLKLLSWIVPLMMNLQWRGVRRAHQK